MKNLLLLLTIALSTHTFATHRSDSLENTLSSVPDTLKVRNLNLLAWEFMYNNSAKAYEYATRSLRLSESISYERGITKALNILGVVYDVRSSYDSALLYYNKALEHSIKLADSRGTGSAHNNIGLTYWNQGKRDQALYHYFKAVQDFSKINDTLNSANAFSNIGLLYWDKHKTNKSIHFLRKAESLYHLAQDKHGLGACWSNIGMIMVDIKQYDSAFYYYQKSITIKKEINDLFGLGKVYSDMAIMLNETNRPREALPYLLLGIKIEEQNDDFSGASRTALSIADVYGKLGNSHLQEQYLHTSEQYAKNINSNRLNQIISVEFSKFYAAKGNYRDAYNYRLKYEAATDSILNTETEKQILEIQTKYETAQKDLQITEQQAGIRKREMILVIISILFASLIVLAFLLYNRYKLKQQAILDAELLRQQSLRNKAIIEAEEKERIRIAKDLHDGVGQQISAVKMNLSALDHELQLNSAQKDKMETLLILIDDAVKEVRSVSHHMMPNALIRSGLSTAVREFVNKVSSVDAIKIDLQIVGLNDRLEKTTETVLYRVLQESVSNIIRHAHATHISIQLIKHTHHLSMVIEDNGTGFDTSVINDESGIGIKNMISRVEFLNGTIVFDSTPGKGTTVVVDIPQT